MPDYDFLNLSPAEFEELSRDLLQKEFGVRIESFTQGRDGGIDLRFQHETTGAFIVQCKRYKDYSDLKSNLKKEAEKVAKLKFDRYVLTTSVGLTPPNKDEIIGIFNGLIKDPSDILGNDELNGLLGKYPDIEKQHYKLWLSSTAILEKLLHLDIYGRSEFEAEEIRRNIRLYVQNESHSIALKLLKDNNYTIISGIPGIGKTTLAKIICYQYISKDYELVAISMDITEAEKVYKKGEKQLFYYDDFLGRNFLASGLDKNEDVRLIKFIERVHRSKNKKLILTTREYILNQARMKHDALESKVIDISQCIIDLSKYSKLERAKILCNHLFFSQIPSGFINRLLHKKRYMQIISHPNYNPRIIEFMTQEHFVKGINEDDYYDFFIINLNNPSNIWKHSFENQISALSRYTLYGLMISGGNVSIDILERTFVNLVEQENEKYSFATERDSFKKTLKELESTFIEISNQRGELIVQFQNPSIQDFIVAYVNENNEIIDLFLDSASFFNQLVTVFAPYGAEDIKNKIALSEELTKKLVESIKAGFSLPSYKLSIYAFSGHKGSSFEKRNLNTIEKIISIKKLVDINQRPSLKKLLVDEFNKFVSNPTMLYNAYEFIDLLTDFAHEENLLKEDAIHVYIQNMRDIEDIEHLEWLEDYFPDEYRKMAEELDIDSYIESAVDSDISSTDEPDEDIVSEKISQIETIEGKYGINLSYYKSNIEGKFEELSGEGYIGEDPNQEYYRSDRRAEERLIDNLFDSLSDRANE